MQIAGRDQATRLSRAALPARKKADRSSYRASQAVQVAYGSAIERDRRSPCNSQHYIRSSHGAKNVAASILPHHLQISIHFVPQIDPVRLFHGTKTNTFFYLAPSSANPTSSCPTKHSRTALPMGQKPLHFLSCPTISKSYFILPHETDLQKSDRHLTHISEQNLSLLAYLFLLSEAFTRPCTNPQARCGLSPPTPLPYITAPLPYITAPQPYRPHRCLTTIAIEHPIASSAPIR